jgi:hypothetical protein
MFSARSATVNVGFPRPGPAVGKNVAVEAFIRYFAVKARVTCAAFLVAGG